MFLKELLAHKTKVSRQFLLHRCTLYRWSYFIEVYKFFFINICSIEVCNYVVGFNSHTFYSRGSIQGFGWFGWSLGIALILFLCMVLFNKFFGDFILDVGGSLDWAD